MMPSFLHSLAACFLGAAQIGHAADTAALVREAIAAEATLDSRRALDLFLAADKTRPNDPAIVQKIARQYSDLVVEQKTPEEKKRHARIALEFAERAVQLDPANPVNVLSVAICHETLGVYSDPRTKIAYSHLVKEEAERALALDPNYAWAHHVLGRWHHEVATLGSTSRFFVRLLYGGLPPASTAKAVEALSRAVALDPGQLEHVLELGFAYAANQQVDLARVEFQKGLAMPAREKHSELAKERAREKLARLE